MSPYPGGKHGPGHYVGGGGGFLQGDIRVGSVGATEVGPGLGQPQHTIPAAPANVGDELWVITHATGPLGAEVSGNWVQNQNVNAGRQQTWRRVADGTANDDFIMPASALFVVAKMWSLQEFLIFDNFPSAQFQGGFLNQVLQIPWDVGFPPGTSLTLNITQDPKAYVYMFGFQWGRFAPAFPSLSIANSPITPMETIMSEAHQAPTAGFATDTLYTLVQFAYTNPSIAYAEYTIGYSPATQALDHWTQHQRYQIS